MSKHEIDSESGEQRTITSSKEESGPRRSHSAFSWVDTYGSSALCSTDYFDRSYEYKHVL